MIASAAQRARIDNARERDHRDIGSATTDVYHQVAARLGDRHVGANGGHHRLLHEMNFRGLSAVGRVCHGALFHLGDLRRYADNDAGVHKRPALVRLLDEVAEHLFRYPEVGNHAVFQRFDNPDIGWRTAQHLLSFFADCLHLASTVIEGDG